EKVSGRRTTGFVGRGNRRDPNREKFGTPTGLRGIRERQPSKKGGSLFTQEPTGQTKTVTTLARGRVRTHEMANQ
ncbi:TPA: hypothetical protein ACKRZC_004559, partial [Pseudomonas aeruginosa]